jgi:hypothetical protein
MRKRGADFPGAAGIHIDRDSSLDQETDWITAPSPPPSFRAPMMRDNCERPE